MKNKYLLLIAGALLTIALVSCGDKEVKQAVTEPSDQQVSQSAVPSANPSDQPLEVKDDGKWEHKAVKDNMAIKAIVTDGNVYVGYSQEFIAYSYNGLDWEVALKGEELFLNTIMYGNGTFFASAGHETYYQSNDGINWTSYDVSSISYNQTYTGVYAEGKFVSIDEGGHVVTSADGIHWEKYHSKDNPDDDIYLEDVAGYDAVITDIIYENGRYIAGVYDSCIFVSNGLDHWDMAVFEDNPYEIVWDIKTIGNKAVCAGLAQLTVIDLDTLKPVKSNAEEGYYLSLEKYEGKLIAFKAIGEVLVSADGITWNVLFEKPADYMDFYSATIIGDMI
ncbi:MAG: hypothetical protein JXQ23_10405, partial [Clostridia bacterium]|nr:hypothetical protein [Clostridia bacterium]